MLKKHNLPQMLFTFNFFESFIIGTCIGSFLNVIVYRLPNNLSIVQPRSFCPNCKKKISWTENIPLISWLIQKGKCKNCKSFISLRYPLIELITGILFVIFLRSSSFLYSQSSNFYINTFFSWLFLSILICISLIDISEYWIPQSLINFGFISGICGLVLLSILNNKFVDFYFIAKGLITSITAYSLFESLRYFAKYLFKKDAIGKGDSKLVAMFALWLGPTGTLFAVAISYIFAAIYCLVGLSMNLLSFKQIIPFAPFLSIGGLIVWFLGNEFIFEKILQI